MKTWRFQNGRGKNTHEKACKSVWNLNTGSAARNSKKEKKGKEKEKPKKGAKETKQKKSWKMETARELLPVKWRTTTANRN